MVFNLEEQTRRLIALKLLTSSAGSFSDRAKRRFEKTRGEIGEQLKQKPRELPKDSGLAIKLGWDDEAVAGARKISLAIEEFKQKYPDYGEKLQGLIDIHRSTRRTYLEFGGTVSDDVYIGIVQGILGEEKVSYATATEIYKVIIVIGEILSKDDKTLQKSLLSE